jgi:hypothetical protein
MVNHKELVVKIFTIVMFVTLVVMIFGVSAMATDERKKEESPCAGRQWEKPGDRLDCKFPYPPHGRWKAVYTKEFAEAHNLPPENISGDLSPGIDYMEMDVLPRGDGRTVCLANMLVKKPHDMALYPSGHNGLSALPEDRKLIHLIDLDQYKDQLKPISSFNSASRDYLSDKRGFRLTTLALYAEDILPGYDYISADAVCRYVSLHPQYFPDGHAFWISKASVWGRYEMLHRDYDDSETPKGQDFHDSHFFINIPQELVSAIFKDVPIGG